MVAPTKNHDVKGPREVRKAKDIFKIDRMATDVCIRCDKGGKVLVCNESGCPLAIHEKCLGFPARFGKGGAFYCPYCLYKKATSATCEARNKALLKKKALLAFIDGGIKDGNREKLKNEITKRKEQTLSTVSLTIFDRGNRLGSNDIHNQPVQLEEEREGRQAPSSNLPCKSCKETNALVVNKQNDLVVATLRDGAGLDDSGHQRAIVEHQSHLGPIIACGGDGVCCREESVANQFQVEEVSKSVAVEHVREIGGRQLLEYEQAGSLSASPEVGESALKGSISTKRKWKNAEIAEGSDDIRTEDEFMQEHSREIALSYKGAEPVLQVHSTSNRQVEAVGEEPETTSTKRRHVKRKDRDLVQPQDVDSLRRSARKLSSELATTSVKNEKIIASSNLRQPKEPPKLHPNPTSPNGRRKKLPWKNEEEEMLKEGVQKFSTTVNKNIPWRKILDFGRHIFDATRTPVDLKDKWRNMMAKGCSTK